MGVVRLSAAAEQRAALERTADDEVREHEPVKSKAAAQIDAIFKAVKDYCDERMARCCSAEINPRSAQSAS